MLLQLADVSFTIQVDDVSFATTMVSFKMYQIYANIYDTDLLIYVHFISNFITHIQIDVHCFFLQNSLDDCFVLICNLNVDVIKKNTLFIFSVVYYRSH